MKRPAARYVDVRSQAGAGRLLFRYDPFREIIEIGKAGRIEYVDLAAIRNQHSPASDEAKPEVSPRVLTI